MRDLLDTLMEVYADAVNNGDGYLGRAQLEYTLMKHDLCLVDARDVHRAPAQTPCTVHNTVNDRCTRCGETILRVSVVTPPQSTLIAEECARIAESHVGMWAKTGERDRNIGYDEACRDIAKAIRDTAPAQPAAPTIDSVPSCGQENDYRRATPAVPQTAWHPIETAPKDGTSILVVFDETIVAEAAFDISEDSWWLAQTGAHDFDPSHAIYPTLWQSMPVAPLSHPESKP